MHRTRHYVITVKPRTMCDRVSRRKFQKIRQTFRKFLSNMTNQQGNSISNNINLTSVKKKKNDGTHGVLITLSISTFELHVLTSNLLYSTPNSSCRFDSSRVLGRTRTYTRILSDSIWKANITESCQVTRLRGSQITTTSGIAKDLTSDKRYSSSLLKF